MTAEPADGLLQDLRSFTVQIRHGATDEIVGTGIAVATDGQLVTCAHVVEAAGVAPKGRDGAEVGVYFPEMRGLPQVDGRRAVVHQGERRRAVVDGCFPQFDDDVVVLRLVDGPMPRAAEELA